MDIGDKPAKFVGSKQWIGSMELGWVLEQWYQVGNLDLSVRAIIDMDHIAQTEFPVMNKYIAQVQGSDIAEQG